MDLNHSPENHETEKQNQQRSVRTILINGSLRFQNQIRFQKGKFTRSYKIFIVLIF